jgi:hypothetical protein
MGWGANGRAGLAWTSVFKRPVYFGYSAVPLIFTEINKEGRAKAEVISNQDEVIVLAHVEGIIPALGKAILKARLKRRSNEQTFKSCKTS